MDGVDIRYPNINAQTAEGKISQMQSYMMQLVQQLNFALNTINSASSGDADNVSVNGGDKEITPEEAQNTFNSIKALIIKSADIVKAYEETLSEKFSGEYVAQSDFGTYTEQTSLLIETNSKGITENYSDIQKLNDEQLITDSYIKRGIIDTDPISGEPIIGLEIGQTDDGGKFKKCARFVSDKLSFYDENDNEVAYISKQRLYITDAVFKGTILFGKYIADVSDGLAFTWIGG